MTSLELYKRFLIKLNKNDTNRNINIPKGQFVLLYNEQRPIWLENRIEEGLGTDAIDDIGELLILDTELERTEVKTNFTSFKLPLDFFDYSSSYSLASKEGCSQSVIYNWNCKNKNKNELQKSENDKPSFEYQETFVSQNNNLLSVYKNDFEVDSAFLDYYRLPRAIDIKGYTNIDGSQSQDINPDISDKLVNEILEYCKRETIKIYVTPEAFESKNKN